MAHLSGHLKETLMRVYDMRPSTAEEVMEIVEHISLIEKREYAKGFAKGYEEGKKHYDVNFVVRSFEFVESKKEASESSFESIEGIQEDLPFR